MNKIITVIIVIVVLGAAALTGFLSLDQGFERQDVQRVAVACLDFNPPSTTDTISFDNSTYGLIKKDAQVREDSKFLNEMVLVGEANGKKLYVLKSTNYFGQEVSHDVIFLLKNEIIASPYIFDIYIKSGVPIPEYIVKCKATGGELTIIQDSSGSFPPGAFNRADIKELLDPTIPLGFVYNQNKVDYNFVINLPARQIGTLFVKERNRDFPIFFHLGTAYLVEGNNAYEYLPSETEIDLTKKSRDALQLQKIVFVQTPTYSWWTPSCKPAIYLYPKERINVSVKVNTKGYFTFTDPPYLDGWKVTADPSGLINYNNKIYPYLYYESKIQNSIVKKPEAGYVVEYKDIPSLFDRVLPKLGLNAKETKEFKEYWEKVLPYAPYYFVGIMTQDSIEAIEPLDITPRPDTLIRVRIYFEALRGKVPVPEPRLSETKRDGFTVVEWGGMIELDKNSHFMCSQ